jgi:hypothetical protein
VCIAYIKTAKGKIGENIRERIEECRDLDQFAVITGFLIAKKKSS